MKHVGTNKGGIEVYFDEKEGMLLARRSLDEMPFDRWDSEKWGFVHATGYEWFNYRYGSWEVEYEDDPIPNGLEEEV